MGECVACAYTCLCASSQNCVCGVQGQGYCTTVVPHTHTNFVILANISPNPPPGARVARTEKLLNVPNAANMPMFLTGQMVLACIPRLLLCVCVCVRARARARVCVCVLVCACECASITSECEKVFE